MHERNDTGSTIWNAKTDLACCGRQTYSETKKELSIFSFLENKILEFFFANKKKTFDSVQ